MENDFGALTLEYESAPSLGLHAIHVARDLEAEQTVLEAATHAAHLRNQAELTALMDDNVARHDARVEMARAQARLRSISSERVAVAQQAAKAAQLIGSYILPVSCPGLFLCC